MICLETVKRFCKDPIEWIENYQEAVNDQTQTWDCHHRHEIEYNLSKIELQAMGFYFNRPFYELLFLTPKEHISLHHRGKEGYWKGKEGPNKGKQFPEETRKKMSDVRKGRTGENAPNYKYRISAEELYDLYIVQDLSAYRIAKMYGCHHATISQKLKKYNIKK